LHGTPRRIGRENCVTTPSSHDLMPAVFTYEAEKIKAREEAPHSSFTRSARCGWRLSGNVDMRPRITYRWLYRFCHGAGSARCRWFVRGTRNRTRRRPWPPEAASPGSPFRTSSYGCGAIRQCGYATPHWH